MPSGNAMAHLYFTNHMTRVFYENLTDEHQWIIEELLEQRAIDFIGLQSKSGPVVVLQSRHPTVNDNNNIDLNFHLSSIFKSQRCGDVILCAKKGFDLRDEFEFPRHRASHGSLIPEHMEIPLCSNKKLPNTSHSSDVYSIVKQSL